MTDLQEAVDQLQAVPLEDFVAERKRLAKELRSGGDRDAAAELAKLPKPSAPAWALNHVAREEPAAVADWLEASGALRDASTHADRSSGDALRAAMAAHRDATRQLLATVRDHARPNGRPLTEPMLDRVRDLLQAATADESRADALQAGRVVEGDEDAALPEEDGETTSRSGRPSKRRSTDGTATGRPTKRRSSNERAASERADPDRAAATRAAKEREAREAREAAELERLVAEVEARVSDLRDAADERAAAVASAEERLEDAQRALHRSESEVAAAREAAEEAAEAAEHAERELRTLTAKLSS